MTKRDQHVTARPPVCTGHDGLPLPRDDVDGQLAPTKRELMRILRLQYGPSKKWGWGVRMRRRFGYFTPDTHYEALMAKLIARETNWLDVGCGHTPFPHHQPLARLLAGRCALLYGVDPDATTADNGHCHAIANEPIDSFCTDHRFDVITLRMVAEHLTNPRTVVANLAKLTRPGGKIVVFTVHRWSPAPLIASVTPLAIHHVAKRFLWKSNKEDTFPTVYRMNTERSLREAFCGNGFRVVSFQYLDDCRTFARFRILHFIELVVWKALAALRLRYQETCLLGVYERIA